MASRAPITGAPTRASSIDRRSLFAAAAIVPAFAAAPALATASQHLPSAALASAIAKYRLAYATYQKFSEEVSDPAIRRRCKAVEDAKGSIPHVEMAEDRTDSLDEVGTMQSYTSASRVDVICAKVSAERERPDASLYTDAQHRHFALLRDFHNACLDRDARIAEAVAEAQARHEYSAITAQEDRAWAAVRACETAVQDYRPTTVADLAAKLAFYAEACTFDDRDELLESVTRDVGSLCRSAVN